MNIYEPQTIRQECINKQQQLLEQAVAALRAKGCIVHMAKDSAEAVAIVAELCPAEQKALCTFAPELNEINLQQVVPHAIQTDLEAIVSQRLKQPYINPRRAPLDNVAPEQITEILQQYFTEGTTAADAKALSGIIKRQIITSADKADWGITGLSGIAADTGTIILAEDQGNERLVSNIPTRHLAIAGLEKIYPSSDTALESIHAAWQAGSRQNTPVYYSYITGPSRTGDIEGIIVCGMHGPLEVHVVLLDNGRSQLLAAEKGQVLKCIECGACSTALQDCTIGQPIPTPLTCKSLALTNLHTPIHISDTQWSALNFHCPVGISKEDLQNAME